MDANGGKLPIQEGIDIFSVGTALLRFLELAKALNIPVAVVTDNDGGPDALDKKYVANKGDTSIKICFDPDVDEGDLKVKDKPFNYNTLEPKLLKANGLTALNTVLGTAAKTDDELRLHMRSNKPESALAIFGAEIAIKYPDYITRAIAP